VTAHSTYIVTSGHCTFILLVDTTSDCHLSYEPLGWTIPFPNFHYIQSWCPPDLYLLEIDPSICITSHDLTATSSSSGPVLIEDNSADVPSPVSMPPVLTSPGNPASEASTLQLISTLLQSLHELVHLLTLGIPLPSMPPVFLQPRFRFLQLHPFLHPVLAFSLPCHVRMSFAFFITRAPLSRLFVLATPLMNLTPRVIGLIGWQRNSIIV
jgi:hypothetical protein